MVKSKKAVKVKRQSDVSSNQWGIYVNGKLVEGGFFSKEVAEETAIGCNGAFDISHAAAVMGRKGGSAKSERKAKSSAANGIKGGRPKTLTWLRESNFITAKITHKGLILENWTCNPGAVSGRKILIKGEKEMPTDETIQLYSEILQHGDADNIVVIRTGIKVQ